MSLSPQLMQIASGAAGIYFIVTDNSAVPTYTAPSKLPVVFINSKFGPVNCGVTFAQGAQSQFTSIFGSGSTLLEKQGNFSHKTCLDILANSPLMVVNLRAFDNTLDTVGIMGVSPNETEPETLSVPYSSMFNTNTLWAPAPKNMAKELTTVNLLNFANIGTNNKSIFVKLSTNPEIVSSNYEDRLIDSDLEIPDYPALTINPELRIKDTVVDVYIFDTIFNPVTVSTNPYYGHLFTPSGMISSANLEILKTITEAGFNQKITGTIIPGFKNENNADVSISTLVNSTYGTTGLICYINDDALEFEHLGINSNPVLNTDGIENYDTNGDLDAEMGGMLLSYRLQPVTTNSGNTANYHETDLDAITDADVVDFSSKQIVDVVGTDIIDLVNNKALGVFEQQIRVGDKLKFDTADVTNYPKGYKTLTITSLNLVEEVAPSTYQLTNRTLSAIIGTSINSNTNINIAVTLPATVNLSTNDKLTIYRKKLGNSNSTYTPISVQSITNPTTQGGSTINIIDTNVSVGIRYVYYAELKDVATLPTNKRVNSAPIAMDLVVGQLGPLTTPAYTAIQTTNDTIASGSLTANYLKSWKKVAYSFNDKIPSDATYYQRVQLLNKYDEALMIPTGLLSYQPRAEQFTNGTASRQNQILDMMNSKGIVKGLKVVENLRYLVDAFKSFVEPDYKKQFGQLAFLLDKSNKFVRCILNEPFIEDLQKSTDPLFKDTPDGDFDIKYLSTGGNTSYTIQYLTKLTTGAYMCYFFGSEYDGLREFPTAGKIANMFINKTFDWDVVANETGVINLIGLPIIPDDEERKPMEDFRWNPFIKVNTQYRIYGNLDGQKTMTGLTQIHNSELLCYIKQQLYTMGRSEPFKKGLYNEYVATQTEISSFMQGLVNNGAIQPNPVVICDASNNTPDVSKQRIKLIHIEYTQVDALDKVVFDLNLY